MQLIGAFLLFFVVFFFIVLAVVKFGSKTFMKFWGADAFVFDVRKRIKIVCITSAVLSLISIIAMCIFM